jgi:predicted DNA-binding transcriptional regulator AlpA
MQAEIVKSWLTYKEAEQLVGLSRTTLWKLINEERSSTARWDGR